MFFIPNVTISIDSCLINNLADIEGKNPIGTLIVSGVVDGVFSYTFLPTITTQEIIDKESLYVLYRGIKDGTALVQFTVIAMHEQFKDTMTIKAYKFWVNGEEKSSMGERVSFDDIINIAHPGISDIEITHPLWTVTYSYSDGGRKGSGSMKRGEKIFLYDGMIFTCTITSGN